MKLFYCISWMVLLTGMVLLFLHIPGNEILLFVGGLLLFIHSMIMLMKYAKSNLTIALFHFSITIMTVYITGRSFLLGWTRLTFPIGCLLFLAVITLYLTRPNNHPFLLVSQVLFFLFFLYISYLPSYKIFYAIQLNTLLNGEERIYDYHSWDKYSWLLYLRDMDNDALLANQMAQKAITLCIKDKINNEAETFASIVNQHRFQIEHKQWTEYP